MGGLSGRIYLFSATCQVAFTMFPEIFPFGDLLVAPSRSIVAHISQAPQEIQWVLKLTDIIQALENFQDFEPAVRTAVIALRASELGVCQMHFYAITLHADLRGAQ